MIDPNRWSVLIPAAGKGLRLGRGPKALLTLGGVTMLERVVEAARTVTGDIIVGVPASAVSALAHRYRDVTFVAGGPSRQETIAALLERAGRQWVMVHDIARPLCPPELMHAVAAAAEETGAAAAFGPVDVPVATVEDRVVKAHIPARDARLCQSPLAFRADILREAYRRAAEARLTLPSTLELALAAGIAVSVVESDRRNIKITTELDLIFARAILASDDD
jgi:2-C-methyl-D-erythritol 4-phosphate cytidylyltransferase